MGGVVAAEEEKVIVILVAVLHAQVGELILAGDLVLFLEVVFIEGVGHDQAFVGVLGPGPLDHASGGGTANEDHTGQNHDDAGGNAQNINGTGEENAHTHRDHQETKQGVTDLAGTANTLFRVAAIFQGLDQGGYVLFFIGHLDLIFHGSIPPLVQARMLFRKVMRPSTTSSRMASSLWISWR